MLRIGAVQIPNFAGKTGALRSIEHATPQIIKAVKDGARLILLPEAFSGYSYDPEEVWPYLERVEDGECPHPDRAPAASALASLAKQHSCFLGFTLLERTKANDVLNTFLLAHPSGVVTKHHHKASPAAFENFIFSGEDVVPNQNKSRLISLPASALGVEGKESIRLGIAICYENYLENTWHELADIQPDLILAPHCGMVPVRSVVTPKRVMDQGTALLNSNGLSKVLGCPLIFANKCGPFFSKMPLPLYHHFDAAKLFFDGSMFSGGARITDATGALVTHSKSINEAEAVVATLSLSEDRATQQRPTKLSGKDIASLKNTNGFPKAGTIADLWNVPLGKAFIKQHQVNGLLQK